MNWLESVFGVSPDGGNGMAEAWLILGIALAVAMVVVGERRLVRARPTATWRR